MKTITLAFRMDFQYNYSTYCTISYNTTQGSEQELIISRTLRNKKNILLKVATSQDVFESPLLIYSATKTSMFNNHFIKI